MTYYPSNWVNVLLNVHESDVVIPWTTFAYSIKPRTSAFFPLHLHTIVRPSFRLQSCSMIAQKMNRRLEFVSHDLTIVRQ